MLRKEDYGVIIRDVTEAFEIQRLRYLQRYKGKFDERCPVAIDLGGGTAVKYKETFQEIFPRIVRFFRDEDDPYSRKGLADPTRLDQRDNYAEAYDFSLANPTIPILSFDLDADRFGLMINGVIWKGDAMMLPVLESQLRRKPGSPVRVDARTSMIVDEAVKKWGGRIIFQAIGHSKVKQGMEVDLREEAKAAGYDDVEKYIQENPEKAETFQGEFSLHLFRFKPELNDEGKYVGLPVDDAIDFAFYFMQTLKERGAKLGKPCLLLGEYLDLLHEQGVISDNYRYKENNTEIRTPYDPLLKKNLGHAAYEIFRLRRKEGEVVDWIDDGVSVRSGDYKLMLRYSNTSPKVTMKCDAKREFWLSAAERLLSVYYGITDWLIANRNMPSRYRKISESENGFLYEIFRQRAGKELEEIPPLNLDSYLRDQALKEALSKDY